MCAIRQAAGTQVSCSARRSRHPAGRFAISRCQAHRGGDDRSIDQNAALMLDVLCWSLAAKDIAWDGDVTKCSLPDGANEGAMRTTATHGRLDLETTQGKQIHCIPNHLGFQLALGDARESLEGIVFGCLLLCRIANCHSHLGFGRCSIEKNSWRHHQFDAGSHGAPASLFLREGAAGAQNRGFFEEVLTSSPWSAEIVVRPTLACRTSLSRLTI